MEKLFILNYMQAKGDEMEKQLEFVKNFDMDHASPEELDRFLEFLDRALADNQRTRAELAQLNAQMKRNRGRKE